MCALWFILLKVMNYQRINTAAQVISCAIHTIVTIQTLIKQTKPPLKVVHTAAFLKQRSPDT